jgi:hypothetical protein
MIPTLSEGICFFLRFLTTAESSFPIVSLGVDAGHDEKAASVIPSEARNLLFAPILDKQGRLSSIRIEEGHCFP